MDQPQPETPPPAEPTAVDEEKQFHDRLQELAPRAWLTPALVIVNLVVFVVMAVAGVHPLSPTAEAVLPWGANYGPRTLGGEPWRLVASMFIHFGILHLLFNMLALWSAGRLIERLFRTPGFFAVYVVAGLSGSLASIAAHPLVTSAGASGAVFGVYGALGGYLIRQKGAIPKKVLARLRSAALGFVGYNLFFGLTVPGIDNAAHIGGLLGGALVGMALARPLETRPARWPAAVALAVGLVWAGVGVAALPRPPDFIAEWQAFTEVEAKVLEVYNDLVRKGQAGQIDEKSYAKTLDEEVLPRWRAAQARLAEPRRWPERERTFIDLLLRYAGARERAWRTLSEALHANDAAKAEAAQQHHNEAERLLEEMKRFGR
jgi:rhomboid protease GluP